MQLERLRRGYENPSWAWSRPSAVCVLSMMDQCMIQAALMLKYNGHKIRLSETEKRGGHLEAM